MRHFYFDHNATSPVAPEVLRAYLETLAEVPGNASSIHHFGQIAKHKLETARRQVAALIGADPAEIVFTSGGTESDNLAIFGSVPPGSHVVTSSIEHPAVLNSCSQLDATFVPVDREGRVDPDDIRLALRATTRLISIMHANNETGVLQPVAEIAAIAREAGIPFHTDAVQTAGRVPIRVGETGADLLSMSGHKFGAPKGIGVLYVRKGTKVEPRLYGGHHERDRRAGTENVPAAVAMGIAASRVENWQTTAALRDRLESGILNTVPGTTVNGAGAARVPNTSSIRFEGIGGESMVIALDLSGYAVSSGSACSSGAVEPSHVLLAMGQAKEEARSGVRFSLGPSNTVAEVDGLIAAVAESAAHLRRLSPVRTQTSVLAHAR